MKNITLKNEVQRIGDAIGLKGKFLVDYGTDHIVEAIEMDVFKDKQLSEAREALEKIETYPGKYSRYLWDSYKYEGLLSSMRTIAIVTLAKLETPK